MCRDLESIGITYELNEELWQLYYYLQDILEQKKEIINNISLDNSINFNDVKDDVRKFYEQYFELKKIIYSPSKLSLYNFIKKIQINKLSKNINLVSPFDLPITNIEKNQNEIAIDGFVSLDNIFIKNQNYVLVHNISIVKNCVSREIYSHEIAHTQAKCSNKTIDYLDDEVLPIFLEILASDNFNNVTMKYIRLNELFKNLTFLMKKKYIDDEIVIYQKIDKVKYIESTLKAFSLYYKFKNDSLSSNRFRIIDNINDVFNNKITVQTLLKNNNITSENCKTLSLLKK